MNVTNDRQTDGRQHIGNVSLKIQLTSYKRWNQVKFICCLNRQIPTAGTAILNLIPMLKQRVTY